MKATVKSATELREEILEKGGGSVFAERQTQKKPGGWEPKDGKADLKSKKKNKKHRAKMGFDKVTGNKSPQKVASAKKPEQVRADNTTGHDLKGKEECGSS